MLSRELCVTVDISGINPNCTQTKDQYTFHRKSTFFIIFRLCDRFPNLTLHLLPSSFFLGLASCISQKVISLSSLFRLDTFKDVYIQKFSLVLLSFSKKLWSIFHTHFIYFSISWLRIEFVLKPLMYNSTSTKLSSALIRRLPIFSSNKHPKLASNHVSLLWLRVSSTFTSILHSNSCLFQTSLQFKRGISSVLPGKLSYSQYSPGEDGQPTMLLKRMNPRCSISIKI